MDGHMGRCENSIPPHKQHCGTGEGVGRYNDKTPSDAQHFYTLGYGHLMYDKTLTFYSPWTALTIWGKLQMFFLHQTYLQLVLEASGI